MLIKNNNFNAKKYAIKINLKIKKKIKFYKILYLNT